jgi:hypothetical protein
MARTLTEITKSTERTLKLARDGFFTAAELRDRLWADKVTARFHNGRWSCQTNSGFRFTVFA